MIPYYDRGEYVRINGKRHYVIHPNKRKKRKKGYVNPYNVNPIRTI